MSEHGTNAGYERHRRTGTPACDPCKAAHSANNRRWRVESAASKRLKTKAARILRERHALEYLTILRELKADQ